jgi:hypothetical protein
MELSPIRFSPNLEPDQPPDGPPTSGGAQADFSRARREVWREPDAIRQYWKARLEMDDAVSGVQRHGLPEGSNHPPYNPNERWVLLANWRRAIAQQLLTPAPDTAAIAWKKGAVRRPT